MWRNVLESIIAWISEGRTGRFLGFLSGLGLGIVYLTHGFWDTLIFALIIFVCFLLGKKSDNREKWFDIDAVYRWFSDRRFR